MRNTAGAVLAALLFTHAALAGEGRHDERLAAAAAAIAAAKLGGLRGGLPQDGAAFMPEREPAAPGRGAATAGDGMRPGVWKDGIAIAVEARRTASPEL